jgi:AAA ATPase domain
LLGSLGVSGFKAFSGWEQIDFKPITLIYGTNSSGKSSILQSLLLLKQSLDQVENPEALLSPKGKLVDLGGYREFASLHDVSKPVSFRITLDWDEQARVWLPFPRSLVKGQIGLQFTFGYSDRNDTTKLNNVELWAGDIQEPVIRFAPLEIDQQPKNLQAFGFGFGLSGRPSRTLLRSESVNYSHPFWREYWQFRKTQNSSSPLRQELQTARQRLDKLEFQRAAINKRQDAARLRQLDKQKQALTARINNLEKELGTQVEYSFESMVGDLEEKLSHTFLNCRNFLPVEISIDQEDPSIGGVELTAGPALMLAASTLLRSFLQELLYIGPLRDFPDRHYIYSGTFSEYVGKTGKLLPEILYTNRKLLAKVNEQLSKFEIGYKLEISSAAGKSELQDVFAVRLVDRILGVNVSMVDVGFGISQVLPVIVQSMMSSGTTLCIEQPEIHLHPRLQAQLGSLFVETIKPPYSNKFIIETHSEHLFLRLQKMVRNGQISAGDISIIYVDRTPEGSRCMRMRLSSTGELLDRWPDGFFEESYREIFF